MNNALLSIIQGHFFPTNFAELVGLKTAGRQALHSFMVVLLNLRALDSEPNFLTSHRLTRPPFA
jgi:hypothetical protein